MEYSFSLNFFLITTLTLLMLWCLAVLFNIDPETLEMRKSSVTGRSYGIQEMLTDADQTADVIGRLDLFIRDFINYLGAHHPEDKRTERIRRNAKLLRLEESPMEDNVSSFTLNKGELMSLCVREKTESQAFHDYQTLLFVVIHELAHVGSVSTGHGTEFVTNFKWLLERAAESGMYHPEDYSQKPITYCGVKVTNNPML